MGWDKHYGFQLYQSDPSGNYGGWKATCIGNNSAVSGVHLFCTCSTVINIVIDKTYILDQNSLFYILFASAIGSGFICAINMFIIGPKSGLFTNLNVFSTPGALQQFVFCPLDDSR